MIKVEPLDEIGRKYEEYDEDIKSEFYESEIVYIDENITKFDPSDSNHSDYSLSAPTNNTNLFDSTKFICDYCDNTQFDRKSFLATHMVKHKNDFLQKPRKSRLPCTVKGCMKVFEKKKQFDNHRLKVHNIKVEVTVVEKRTKFCCQRCPKSFRAQLKLDAHIRGEHEGLTVTINVNLFAMNQF